MKKPNKRSLTELNVLFHRKVKRAIDDTLRSQRRSYSTSIVVSFKLNVSVGVVLDTGIELETHSHLVTNSLAHLYSSLRALDYSSNRMSRDASVLDSRQILSNALNTICYCDEQYSAAQRNVLIT